MRLFMIGGPCSGKTSVAKLLSTRTGWSYLSTGDLARTLALWDEETRLALEAGRMAPSEKLDEVAIQRLLEPGDLVVDGYPRYVSQYEDIRAALDDVWFVNVWVPYTIAARRAESRGRADDSKFVERWQAYYQHTAPVIDEIVQSDLAHRLIVVDGRKTPTENSHLLSTLLYVPAPSA